MDKVRFAVAGLGNMGVAHADALTNLDNAALAAVCDASPQRRELAQKQYNVPAFADYQQLLASGLAEAVIIATPHPFHADMMVQAFDHGLHVLCEKPVAVHVNDARRMNQAAAKHPNLKFALDFQSRTVPLYQKLKQLLAEGELGEISRITWIATDWFRPWAYYASGGWRATWKHEGGGVLVNQCPHNLDLMQWYFGLPQRITAVGFVGKTHPIEVEDEISAILEYPNGAIGHFITTTGETPGTNRLEIAGDRGKIIVENEKILFVRTRQSVRTLLQTAEAWPQIETWTIDVPYDTHRPTGHAVIIANLADAIRNNVPLLAPGIEGERSVELANGMLMAGLTRQPVTLPVDGDAYVQLLKDLEAQYAGRKTLQTRAATTTMQTVTQKSRQ